MAQNDKVYEIPNAINVDGLIVTPRVEGILLPDPIDDVILKQEDNVLVATYPRTGTTWLGQIMSLLVAGADGYEQTKQQDLVDRVLYLELKFPNQSQANIFRLDTVPPPRVLKTHLPFRFINRWLTRDKLKTIVTTRNPKDTLVSLFHFYKFMPGFRPFSGIWDDFFDHVRAGHQLYGNQLSWTQDWHRNRHLCGDRLLFIKYEDMLDDIACQIRTIVGYLGLDRDEQFIKKLIHDTMLVNMKDDKAANHLPGFDLNPQEHLIRKGKRGEWKKYFTVEQNEWFDKNYKEQYEQLNEYVVYE